MPPIVKPLRACRIWRSGGRSRHSQPGANEVTQLVLEPVVFGDPR
jgi:hypothetical protein